MPAALLERGQRGPDGQRRSVDVGQDHRAPVLRRLLEEASGGAEAGVGESHVEPTEARQRLLDHRLLLLPFGHVAFEGQGALGAAQLLGQLVRAAPRTAPPGPRGNRPPAACRAVAAPMPLEAPVIRNTGSGMSASCQCRIGLVSTFRPAPAATAAPASAARRMCPRAAPTAATAAAAATSCSSATTRCVTSSATAGASHFKAGRGGHGQGALRHGKDGDTLELAVAARDPGPSSRQTTRGLTWSAPGQRATVARGGPGGRGNKRFATPTDQAPRFAERGLPGR